MALDLGRKGKIGLHILSSDEQSEEKFINFFKGNVEEIQFALDDEENFISRLPSNLVESVRERLEKALQLAESGVPYQVTPKQVQVTPSYQGFTVQPVLEGTLLGTEIIATDKGSYFHLEMWRSKLKNVYKHIEGFDEIFANACQEAGVDPTIDYISEVKKKSVTSKLKSCTKAYLDKLADEV